MIGAFICKDYRQRLIRVLSDHRSILRLGVIKAKMVGKPNGGSRQDFFFRLRVIN